MPGIHVEATRIAPTTGMTIIDEEMIENLPTRNGSVNEIIGIIPEVQYSESSFSSFVGGEITPPIISISGSRFYDNNYTIDGISNNNPLDPASDTHKDVNKLQGHPQSQFLNPQIIEQITVYNSNIPAEFGGFTGGQIDTLTISPTPNFWGKIHFRTTNDSWTKFHIDPLDHEDFHNSNSDKMQPNFSKHDFGFILNTPLGADTGLITSYQQLHSKISLQHLDDFSAQTRKRENFFIKLKQYVSNDLRVSFIALYSPTAAKYSLRDFKNSNYTIESKNHSFALQAEKDFDNSQLKLMLGYNGQKTDRDATENRFLWDPSTDSIDWSSGYEGSFGSLETGQDELSIKADISFDTIKLGQTDHRFKFGTEATYSHQRYHRPTTNFYYYSAETDGPIICTPGDPACIENEQYLTRRTKYNQTKADVEIIDYAAFIQDAIIWKRLEIFPGIRISYDNFTDDLNIAPRLSTSFDLLNNGKSILFAGINRYYSGTLQTHALYETIITENQRRTTSGNEAGDWSSTTSNLFINEKVETPYSDELTFGLIQKLLGGELKLQYIKKTSKKEYARTRIDNPYPEPDHYVLNNNGRSEHESYLLSWQRSWKNHFLEINGTWQETTTSNTDYDTILDQEDVSETIWYDNDELHKYEIPRLDFNRPFIANLIYIFKLSDNVTFSNTTKYRGAYWRLWRARDADNRLIRKPSIINPEQPDPYVYEKVKSHDTVTFDWRFSWKTPRRFDQNMIFSLDIFNVFDRKTKIGYDTGKFGYNYEIGRQFWAGLEFNF
ncbi:MAG: TonB-dependent receptor [Desulfuromusa sp.]|nr:TonB-dependent receptor [Desulfuromusa sp.]